MADAEVPYRIDLSRRQLLFGSGMIGASLLAVARAPKAAKPLIGPGGLEKAIPRQLGDWQYASDNGLVTPPIDEVQARVYDQILTRNYVRDGGAPVMLLIAYGSGQTGLFTIHRPEACYPAQGFKLSGREDMPVALPGGGAVEGTFWTAQSDLRTEQLMYWTRIGDDFPRSWAMEHVAVVRANLARRLPDGVLVRLSVLTNDRDEAISAIRSFADALVGHVGPVGRKILLG